MTKAYSYIRFSTPEQAMGDSERRQLDAARGYAVAHGLDLDESINLDKGVSAYRGKNAEEGALGAFLEQVTAGDIKRGSYLLVESLDRISRQDPWTALKTFQKIIDQGVILVTISDSKVYSLETMVKDPMLLMWLNVVLMRAHEESRIKGERVAAAWKAKRASGKPLSEWCPSWLRLKDDRSAYEIIPDRAEIVRRIFREYLAGVGTHAIANNLNRDGVATWGGLRKRPALYWHRTYVVKILDNAAVIGIRKGGTRETTNSGTVTSMGADLEGYYPAVIDQETWDAVRAMRTHKVKRAVNPKDMGNLFANLLRCPRCGGAMNALSKGKQNGRVLRYARCRAADARLPKTDPMYCEPVKPIPYDRIEAAFMGRYGELLADMPMGEATAELENNLLNNEGVRSALEDEIEDLARNIAKIKDPPQSLIKQLREMEDDLMRYRVEHEELLLRIAQASPAIIKRKVQQLDDLLGATPMDRNRVNALLRQLCVSITVNHDEGTLDFEWTHGGVSDIVYAWPGKDRP